MSEPVSEPVSEPTAESHGDVVGGRWSSIAVGAVVALSVVAHLWKLGLRPLAHDEAIDAWFSWQARHGGVMRYDPVYHGPLRFYLEGVVLNLFGTSPGWTRAVAAMAGIASTAIVACSRQTLGRIGAPLAALLFTVSPTVLTVTRTGREDSLVGLVSLAILVLVARALVDPRQGQLVAIAALLATSMALKETTFIFGFAAACFFAAVSATAWRRPAGAARQFVRRLSVLGRYPWMWAVAAFVMVFVFVFTSAFRYPEGFESGLLDGVRYWWGQHDVGRGSQRWSFYLSILAGYEWLILLLVGAGLATTIRHRSMIGSWFATMALVQLVIYSWAGEKFAWLALHPTIPLVLLAGLGIQAIGEQLVDLGGRRIVVAAFGLGVIGTAAIAVPPAITDGADPRELLVTVQTSVDVPVIDDRLSAGAGDGTITSILVDDSDSGAWPWVWYLHEAGGVEFRTLDPIQPLPDGFDAYIVSAAGPAPTVPAGYTIERFRLRVWWLPDYPNAGVGDLASWFVTRRTWSPIGSSDQYLVIREGAGL